MVLHRGRRWILDESIVSHNYFHFLIIFLNIYYIKLNLDLKSLLLFDIAILIQIFLGIITLLSGMEIKYASLHQIGSILVLSSYLYIFYKSLNHLL